MYMKLSAASGQAAFTKVIIIPQGYIVFYLTVKDGRALEVKLSSE